MCLIIRERMPTLYTFLHPVATADCFYQYPSPFLYRTPYVLGRQYAQINQRHYLYFLEEHNSQVTHY